jgi:hypothetical protein
MDAEIRDNLRREELRAAYLLKRTGRVEEAFDFLETRWLAGDHIAGQLYLDALNDRPDSERLVLAPRLHALARGDVGSARETWRSWFPVTATFAEPETWVGGFYELALELGTSSDKRLESALRALWTHPSVHGCYGDRASDPVNQERVALTASTLQERGHLYGFARLPNGAFAACGVIAIQEEHGSDWLVFYVPLGALNGTYPGGHPFAWPTAETRSWQAPLDDWLAAVGRWGFERTPFALGLIGHDVSGNEHASQLEEGPPSERTKGYLWPGKGGLGWFPVTKWEPSGR